jgi:hypothetical protein
VRISPPSYGNPASSLIVDSLVPPPVEPRYPILKAAIALD